MAHVGVERFAARHREKGAADHDEGQRPGAPEVGHGRQRAQRGEHRRRPDDPADAEHARDDEPDEHDGAEQAADPGRAVALDDEEARENDDRQGHDRVLHLRRIELEALDRGEDGDRRRDRAVAIEQRRPDEADHDAARRGVRCAWRGAD